jgi:hypothetical protein
MNFKYFTFFELIKTDTGLQNIPASLDHVENLVALAQVLEDIRSDYGAPIVVTSAYRDPIVNHAVGGVANSFHLQGRAADIRPNLHPSCDYYWNFQNLLDVVKAYEDVLEEIIVDPQNRYIHIAI